MAANLMKRAAEKIKAQTARLQRVHEANKAEEMQLLGAGAAVLGVVGAAAVDKKFGENGEQAEYFELIPVNLANGIALGTVGLTVKRLGNGRLPLGMFGLGMALGSLYKFAYDNFEFPAETK